MSSAENKLRDYLNRVTLDLRKTRRQLNELTDRDREPIAIVGIGCRYPGGVSSADDFWDLLQAGREGIVGFPQDRGWPLEDLYDPDPSTPAKTNVREGGFLADAGQFDAGFFGISPREALAMDPQQRLLLETCWEACEHAALDPLSLRGTSTGVFVGIYPFGYGAKAAEWDDPQGFRLTGTTCSVASGRIAYTLGLEGPAISIDTACSSSLVALHLAGHALRRRECSLALVGGSTVIAGPEIFIDFSRQGGLAPDARCKAFAQAADGTAWGEGVGVLLVERLSDAQRHGHRVLAVVRGSAVNQDGASNGLTAPNGPAQQRVIRAALLDAGLSPADIDAVEAHGTATELGDPIEAQALLASYGSRPAKRPLWLGSVKSNVGHTQAAAGIAGVIKMTMALKHQSLPKTLHVDRPSSQVDWSTGSVSLLTEERPWPIGETPRRAGVSSFGISGTNAHVILEEAPEPGESVAPGESAAPKESVAPEESVAPQQPRGVLGAETSAWVLSARTDAGLSAQAETLGEYLDEASDLGPSELARALARRPSLEHRAVLFGNTREGLMSGLDLLARGERTEAALCGRAAGNGRVVFVFPGQGSQWQGMARELLEKSPVFAEQIQACEEALAAHVDWSLRDVLGGAPGSPGLERIDVVQPVLFAAMVSLARLWRACGVQPAAVVGHSQGEIAAAYVAGALSLEDAARVIAVRGRALAKLAGNRGGMMSVALDASQLADRLGHLDPEIVLAARNGPSSIVLSGPAQALRELQGRCEEQDVRARIVPVEYAAHSPQVESVRELLIDGCDGVKPGPGELPFYSAVTGGLLDAATLDAEYWYRNVREPVAFEAAMRSVLSERVQAVVEVSPHPVLTIAMRETLDAMRAEVPGGDRHEAAKGDPAPVLGSLRRDEPECERMLTSLSEAWVHGIPVDWPQVLGASVAEHPRLPSYPFQREHYWLDSSPAGDAGAVGQAQSEHPLLGSVVALADESGWLFTGRLSLKTHPWLGDHAVAGTVLLPGTALLELALHAGARAGCERVGELVLETPLTLEEGSSIQLQVSVGAPEEDGRRRVQIHARRQSATGEDRDLGDGWTRHASGMLEPGEGEFTKEVDRPQTPVPAVWPPPGAAGVDVQELYETLADRRLEYGPAFQGLEGAWRLGEELFVEASVSEQQREACSLFAIHPALLDACLHPGAGGQPDSGSVGLPFSWRDVQVYRAGATRLRMVCSSVGDGEISLLALDEQGAPVLSVGSLLVRSVAAEQLRGERAAEHSSLYELNWVPGASAHDSTLGCVAVLGEHSPERRESLGRLATSLDFHADLDALADAIEGGAQAPDAVLWEGMPQAIQQLGPAAHEHARETLRLAQAWLASPVLEESALIVMTRGAVAVQRQDTLPGLRTSASWGLVRSAQAESPGRFLLVDVDEEPASFEALGPAIARAIGDGESQLAIRDGRSYLPRLARAKAMSSSGPLTDGGASKGGGALTDGGAPTDGGPPTDGGASKGRGPLKGAGTVLLTGGTGELGGALARHLVLAHGVTSIVLAGRAGPQAPGANELGEELTALGAATQIVACDVSDRSQLERLIDSISAESDLVGVVHAAGVLEDGLLGSLSPEQLDRVLAPKLDAAVHLHELTNELDLRMFILFSSAAGVFGAPGQANYAAANSFLDALAAHRRSRGLVANSMAWGLWEQTGAMVAHMDESDLARMRRAGVRPLSSVEGLDLFDAALELDRPLSIPVALDMPALRATARSAGLAPLLSGLVRSSARQGSRAQGAALSRRLASLDEQGRRKAVGELVRGHVAAVLGHSSAGDLEPGRTFKDLGFDSLLAVELSNRLSGASGVRLAATLVFDYPTVEELAAHLLARMTGENTSSGRAFGTTTSTSEPIAIVGMSCRFPGNVDSPAALWDLVARGGDGISAFPADRGWPLEELLDAADSQTASSRVLEGGFLYDAPNFDAAFFGIGPREASAMDPQQRLLLEACWEALEHAGIDPLELKGSETAVFAGISSQDYGLGGDGLFGLDGYGMTGSAASVISGRVAYTFGFEGPAVTVDTACSSALVSMHLACQSLQAGESSLALAGGVTVQSSPAVWLEFNRQQGLAPDARCKPFADSADGATFSEGVGLVALERLSDAQRLGHEVLALVRGSAVNQDGASNGLTAPNGPSQQRVIRRALANAGLAAHEIDAVEAHGTGTTLGDPIEAQALLATYGHERSRSRPLRLGSVKSNIGHTQAAAGAAGVIKMVMALRRETLPQTLHVDRPAASVDWSAGAISLLTEAREWPRGATTRRAGVSSFGISGTNAHLILEEAPAHGSGPSTRSQASASAAPEVAWPLSGKGEAALRAQAHKLVAHLGRQSAWKPADVAAGLARRSAFEDRAVATGSDREELLHAVQALSEGRADGKLVQGTAPPTPGKLAFLFSGQGAQRPGMGSELFAALPVFRAAFQEVCLHLDPLLEQPLAEVLFASEGSPQARLLDETAFTQPALFAFEVALFRQLQSVGVRPDYLIGHSIGELAAAHVAGVLSLGHASTLVAGRGRLMGSLAPEGAMVAVQASESELAPALEGLEQEVSVGAVNGASATVLSGAREAVESLARSWESEGRKVKRLTVSHAFHSPLMEPILEELAQLARGLTFNEPSIPIVSNLTGEPVSGERMRDPLYWREHARQAVRFADGIDWLRRHEVRRFLEVGPDGVLAALCHESREGQGNQTRALVAVPALRRDRIEPSSLSAALAALWVDGVEVDWAAFEDTHGAPAIELPTYAFQRERHWLQAAPRGADLAAAGIEPEAHPLLGATVALPGDGGALFTGRVSLARCPWLADHLVMGVALLPGTALLELALHAGSRLGCHELEELTLEAPLALHAEDASQLQVSVGEPDEHGRRALEIRSSTYAEGEHQTQAAWRCHARGTLIQGSPSEGGQADSADRAEAQNADRGQADGAARAEAHALVVGAWPPQGAQELELDGLYGELAELGLEYGPAFQRLQAAWRHRDRLLVEVAPAENEQGADGFALHPALLDCALHASALHDLRSAPGSSERSEGVRVPFAWRGVKLHAARPGALRICISDQPQTGALSLIVASTEGDLLADIDALQTRPISVEEMVSFERAGVRRSSYLLGWEPLRVLAPPRPGQRWAVSEDSENPLVCEALRAANIAVDSLAGSISDSQNGVQDPVQLLLIDCAGHVRSLADEGVAEDPIAAVHLAVRGALASLQSWLSHERLQYARCALVTHGAVSVDPKDAPPDLAQAAVAGMVRSAQAEHPGRLLHIDLPGEPRSGSPDADWGLLPAAIATALQQDEPQLAIRDATILVARLVGTSIPTPIGPGSRDRSPDTRGAFGAKGTTLITGGTGALGSLVAKHLVSAHGVRSLLLTSRRGPEAEGAGELQEELERLGARVLIRACDMAEREQAEQAIASLPPELALSAVVHMAGTIEDGVLESLTSDALDRVLAPKLDAAIHLHELTKELELSAFVLFSSIAGTFGGPGQANYAAANAALDALAMRRRAEGLPALSLVWGPWASTGLATDLSRRDRARIADAAIETLEPEDGLELFDTACSKNQTLVVAARLNPTTLRSSARAGKLPALFRGLLPTPARSPTPRGGPLAHRLAEAAEEEAKEIVLGLVREQAALVLGHGSPEKIPAERAFKDLGFDSLAAIELRNRLDAATGLRLTSTLIFDYPEAASLAEHLLGRLSERAAAPRAVAAPARAEEPIAIVGMACRYPGAVGTPQELWELVSSGRDAISPFPEDRGWNLDTLHAFDAESPGSSHAMEGGFVRDAANFDAAFFGVGPREALAMDPQQRLLLEASWEALEDAQIDPASLKGSQTGVYAGVMYQDYASSIDPSQAAGLEGYLGTGSSGSIVSGRLAYTFGLQGPAVSVNTACSSSLVAAHWACQALREGECSLALVGGVTVMWTPAAFVEFSRQRGLAADGRCKSYADSADGTGWGEGVGVLVLERLSEARRHGHTVFGLIRGSAINQDGASNGLTAPNGPSQQQVIGQALANAGLSTGDIDAVEGHGTGTALGDPIEAQALLATYGQSHDRKHPLWLGSIKSNIGHTQAAAGVAGVIKMVMAMRHGVLPRTLHIDRPSTEVDWSAGAVSLLSEAQPWERFDRPRRAAVSSFGISGTNAHMILEEAPSAEESLAPESPPGGARAQAPPESLPWVLSAGSAEALRGQARRLHDYLLLAEDSSATEVGRSLAKRPRLEHRAVLWGRDREDLMQTLGHVAQGERVSNVVPSTSELQATGEATLAFLFTGQGSQRSGMGAQLYEQLPLYARAFDDVCGHLEEHLSGSVRELVLGAPLAKASSRVDPIEHGSIDHTAFAQAALFALEVALFRLLEGYGVRPDYLIGHSIGELAAAHVAGVFSLSDASRLVAARGRLMGELPTGGAMVAVQASEREALDSLEGQRAVEIAAVNGPGAVVFSGEEKPVLRLAELWESRSRKVKRLRVSHAFHSARMDGMLERFAEVAGEIPLTSPRIPIVSNLTGAPVTAAEICSPDYWVRQVRAPVRFGDGITWLGSQGVRGFLELGPDGVLSAMAADILGGAGDGVGAGAPVEAIAAVPLLRRDRPEGQSLMSALGELFARGVQVDWASMFEDGGTPVKLPTYAFDRKHYWLEPRSPSDELAAVGQSSVNHPLLGAALTLAGEHGGVLTGRVSLREQPWLADHAVLGTVLLPGTAFVELALHAGRELGAEYLHELTFESPLALEEGTEALLQVSVGEVDEHGNRTVAIYSRARQEIEALSDESWTRHASGTLGSVQSAPDIAPLVERGEESWPPRDAQPLDTSELYDRLGRHGLDYGPAFQCVRRAWRRDEELFVEVALADDVLAEHGGFSIHPALLDSAFHVLIDELDCDAGAGDTVSLPFSFAAVTLGAGATRSLRVQISRGAQGTVSLVGEDESGAPVVRVGSVLRRDVSAQQVSSAHDRVHESMLRPCWSELPLDAAEPSSGGRWELLGHPDTAAAMLARLRDTGLACELYDGAWALAVERGSPPVSVTLLDCRPLASERLPGSVRAATTRVLDVLQQWLARRSLADGRLVVLTSASVAVRAPEECRDLAGAAVWGLVQSAQAEHPGRLVLVDCDEDSESWRVLVRALQSAESRLALRAGTAFKQTLARVPRDAPLAPAFDPQRTVLITGGTGGLGALLARHLVRSHGVRSLLLASRSGPSAAGAAELERELSELGAHARIVACDVGEREQLQRLLDSVESSHPLGAVVHSAATMDNGLLDSLTPERLGSVLAPKAEAAWHLHELTASMELSAFILFSSVAGIFGGPGQGSYAAANLFLDRLAEYRRARGLAATSIAWGLWEQAGAGAEMGQRELTSAVGSAGLRPLARAHGLELFDRAAAGTDPMVVAAPIELSVLRAEARSGSLPPLLRGLVRIPQAPRSAPAKDTLRDRLAETAEEDREDMLLALVRSESAGVLGLDSPSEVGPSKAFKEAGFDSLAAVELRNRLGAVTGLRLPATLIFDCPSPRELAQHLLGELDREQPDGTGTTRAPSLDRALEDMELSLARMDGEPAKRRRVAARLRACLSALEEGGQEVDLDAATDEEMFEILDTELGAL